MSHAGTLPAERRSRPTEACSARTEGGSRQKEGPSTEKNGRSAQTEGPPLALVRRGGAWRVPVSELSKDVEAADVEKNLADMNRQTKLMRELSIEVAAHQYATATEARQVLDKRILSSSLPPMTTRPAASSPAAQP